MTCPACGHENLTGAQFCNTCGGRLDAGNDAIRSGKVAKVMERLAQELKPEAAYFYPDLGDRAGFFIIDMREASQVAEVAERFFFGLNAEVEMTPVMSVEDLQKGLSGIETIIKNYG